MGRILNFSIPRSPLNNTTPIESSHAPPSPAGERRCTAAALVLQRHARAWLRRLKSCAGCGRASRGTRAPVETHALRLPARPPVGLALEVQLLDFRPLVSPPSANLRLRCDAHLFGSKARALLSPAVARTRRCACGGPPPPASRRVRAPFSPAPRSQPLPHELHAPQSAPGCVAFTHTVGCPALAARPLPRPQRHACGTRFSPRDTPLAMPTHTASQLHMAHLAPHTHPPERHARRPDAHPIRASRCVCLLCTRLSATSAPDQRPATAKPHHPLHGTRTALQPAARCPRRGSKSQGAGAAGLDASPHHRCAVTSTSAHPTRVQAERGADARPRPQGMERGRRGRFPR